MPHSRREPHVCLLKHYLGAVRRVDGAFLRRPLIRLPLTLERLFIGSPVVAEEPS
jgi:hypothetical protein